MAFILTYLLFLIAFGLYFWLLYSRKKMESFLAKKSNPTRVNIQYFGIEKFSGWLLMMVLPIIVLTIAGLFDTQQLGIKFIHPQKILLCWGLAGGLVLVVNFIRAHKPANYNLYPQIRTNVWTPRLLFYYIGGWAVYLLGYEFLFRGILFFSGVQILPLWANILINTVLYALAHIPKGKLEIIASLPFGVVLCLISWYTGSFWAAWLIHLTLSLSNSLIALWANPNMKVDWKPFFVSKK